VFGSSGPYFHNVLGVLEIDGERGDMRWIAPSAGIEDPPPLQEIGTQRLR
jgi:hypothetical protein